MIAAWTAALAVLLTLNWWLHRALDRIERRLREERSRRTSSYETEGYD